MRSHRSIPWWHATAVPIAAIVFFFVATRAPARADEPRTLCGRTLDGWLDVLRHGKARERDRAAWMLSYFGPEARKAVPDLVDSLRRSADVRRETAILVAIERIGPDAAPAVPLLLPAYRAEGCQLAVMGTILGGNGGRPGLALVAIGAPAVPALIDVLTGPNTEMRACAALHLGEIGPSAKAAVPALVRSLSVDDPEPRDAEAAALRRHAVIALGQIGPDARAAVPALNVLLDRAMKDRDNFSNDESLIVRALDRIGEPPVAKLVQGVLSQDGPWHANELILIAPRAGAAVPALRKALGSPQREVRVDAALALTAIYPPAPDAVRVLISELDPYHEEASAAPEALGRLGPQAAEALPVVLRLAKREINVIGLIEALVLIDPEGKVCIPALGEILQRKDEVDAVHAARALGLLGQRARPAVPALIAELSRENDRTLDDETAPDAEAAKALLRIGDRSPAMVSALIGAVKKLQSRRALAKKVPPTDASLCAIIRVLGELGPLAQSATPVLIEVLKSRGDEEDWEARRDAALALGRIGPSAAEAVPPLREVLKEGPPPEVGGSWPGLPPQISDAVIVALFHLASDGKDLAKAWAEKSRSPERRAFVLGAMGQTSFEADVVTRVRVEDLDSALASAADEGDDTLYIEGYVSRLAEFGVGGRLAVPRLRELLKHRNPWIRQWAGEALGRITGSGRLPDPPSRAAEPVKD